MTINYEYQINSTNYNPATTTFYWRVVSRGAGGGGTAGVVVDDFDTSSGSTLSGGNITTIQVGVKERTGTEGTRNYTLQASTSATFASNVVTKDFQVTDGVAATPVYNSISRSTTSIPEDGATVVTFTVNTSNVIDGTKVGFTFSGTNITGSDFQYSFDNSNWSAGTTSNITNANGVTINSNAGAIYVRALADAAESADETLTITLNATDDASTSTGSLAQSVTISNTSAPAAGSYNSITVSPSSITEGGSAATFTLNTTSITNGTRVGFIVYDTSLDPQPFDAVGTGSKVNSSAFDTNPAGHTWYYSQSGPIWNWNDDGTSGSIVWNGTTIATGVGASVKLLVVGSYEYEKGVLMVAIGNPTASQYAVRRRLIGNTGVPYLNGEFEMSYDGVNWGGAGDNITQLTGSYNTQYHGAFTVNSNTDTVQFRALNEGNAETGESVKLALWKEDDNALSTGNLTSSTLSITDAGAATAFSFDPTFVRHRRFTNNPFLGCSTTSQIDFLRNGSTSIQSTGFGTENVATITPSLDTANNWSNTQNSTFGDNYQILFQVYSDSGLTTLTSDTQGSAVGDAYSVLKGGVATSWTQSTANTWVQLNDDVRIQGTRVEGGTGDGSGAGSSAITNYVKYTIKQYSGVLGTGTTVLTGSFEHKVEASDAAS